MITKPDSLVKRHYIGVPNPRVLGLHARILRTSRQIYQEALPVLYGENVFAFLSSDSLEAFQSKGLVKGRSKCPTVSARNDDIELISGST